jgi:hypothetical protein
MSVQADLSELVERLQAAAGDNLVSLVLYGSAARGDFHERYSDLNLLLVLASARGDALDRLAPALHWWSVKKHHRPPLIFTEEELRASTDVFPIELLDIQLSNRLLAGRDVVSAIAVPMELHRVQLEHDLRAVLLQLRQHYLIARDDHQQLQDAIAKSSSTVLTLFRHALVAMGLEAPESRREVADRIAQLESLDARPLHAALDLREGRRIETGIDTLYRLYLDAVAALVHHVDGLAPRQP